MATVPFNIYAGSTPGGNIIYGTIWGVYFKIGATPSGDTTLLDWNAGAVFYNRIRVTTGMHVIDDIAYNVGSASLDITGTLTLSTGVWYWLWGCVARSFSSSFDYGLSGGIIGPGGVGGGRQNYDNIGGGGTDGTVNCKLGIGKAITGGAIDMPSGSGWAMSKLYQLRYAGASAGNMLGHGPVNPPASDNDFVDSGGQTTNNGPLDFGYNARQSVGAAATLVDAIGSYTAADAGGLTIVADGPFPG